MSGRSDEALHVGPRRSRRSPAAMHEGMTAQAEERTVAVHVPMTFRKRGGRKLVVTPDGSPWAPRLRVDDAMVKALARAFRWRRMLDDGV